MALPGTDNPSTPTDVLIRALEDAELMSQVVVIARIRDAENNEGMAWFTNIDEVGPKIALLEESKFGMWMDACGLGDRGEEE